MRVLLAVVVACVACVGAALAQDPQVTVTAEQEEVVVGQPYLLRIEVLVPTFMPKAPVFPTFEVPGLIVRLPERSTSPISETIDGETWSGVRRTYRIYPMRAGETEISAQQIAIVYKDTETNEDVPLTVDVPATTIRATVPEGARALDPLVIAQQVEIKESWQIEEGILNVGDAVGRSLDISVTGTSALFVPPLLEAALPRVEDIGSEADVPESIPFLAYPEDSKVTESFDRGVMSGTRHEQVNYIAQTGGVTVFPDITLRWFNIDSGETEEIVLEGRSVEVAMPPVERTPLDVAKLIRWAIALLGLALAVWAARRFLWPPMQSRLHALRLQYDATAQAAHHEAVKRAKAHDLNGLLIALDERTRRGCPPGQDLTEAIRALTQQVYRDGANDTVRSWHSVTDALQTEKPGLFASDHSKDEEALPPLNPFTASGPKTVYLRKP